MSEFYNYLVYGRINEAGEMASAGVNDYDYNQNQTPQNGDLVNWWTEWVMKQNMNPQQLQVAFKALAKVPGLRYQDYMAQPGGNHRRKAWSGDGSQKQQQQQPNQQQPSMNQQQ